MKNRWMIIALAFSLAVNVAVIGTLIFFWSRPTMQEPGPPDFGEIKRPGFELGLDKALREQMHPAMLEHRQRIQEIGDSLRIHKRALIELLLAGEENQADIDKAIAETMPLQIALERETIRHLLALRKILGPEQWQHLVRAIENRMPHPEMRYFRNRPQFGGKRPFYQPDTLPKHE